MPDPQLREKYSITVHTSLLLPHQLQHLMDVLAERGLVIQSFEALRESKKSK
jgi:hypothetical protein